MAYDPTKLVTLKNLKDTATRIKTEYLAAIAASGHAIFQKAETIPTAEEAQENVLYLVKNEDTGHYDIYALIDGVVEWLDDVSINLDNYVTSEELSQAIANLGAGSVYGSTKTDLETADTEVINTFFSQEAAPTPKEGDVFVVTTLVDGVTYEMSSYWYDGENWVAITGNVDASKVIMRENITMAGNYTQVGNKTKEQDGTADFNTKGMSVAAILTDIFSKRLQPGTPTQPSISGFNLSGAKAVEAGTELEAVNYTSGTLNAGSYQYGPDTGVVASNWVVQRITDQGTEQVTSVDAASLEAGSDNNGGAGFIIGDMGGEGVVSSLKLKAIATHGAGVTAKDNLGDDSNPPVSISAGTKEKTTGAYTPYRNYFYGATTEKPTLDSTYVRGLTKSNKAYAAGTVTINVPAGAQRVAIACLASKAGVTKVINETAMNADVTSTFVQSTVQVEGANSYTAQEYKVWVFEPAVPYENAATLKVTLG
ncbi:hypothetical protein [Flintibacter porci]|uniref:hypothetical protein n=1 Tax=Flintibacter porci TaxID=3342383 RepID=UPI003F88891F